MNTIYHQEVLEALGMLASKQTICNKLSKAYAKTDDQLLRDMIPSLLSEIKSTSVNTRVMTPKDCKRGIPSATKAVSYCETVLFN